MSTTTKLFEMQTPNGEQFALHFVDDEVRLTRGNELVFAESGDGEGSEEQAALAYLWKMMGRQGKARPWEIVFAVASGASPPEGLDSGT